MSEITNLQIKLQNNPYAQYIIPVIEYFNTPRAKPHPLEAIAIGSIMAERLSSWNNNGPIKEDASYEICCCPELTLSGNNCYWVKKVPGTKGTGCRPCPPSDSTNRVGSSSPNLTTRELLNHFALEDGVADPYTPLVTSFLAQMNGLSMNRANAYLFFQQIVDEFYTNVSHIFIDYIISDWKHRDVFMSMLGGYFRDGFNSAGINVIPLSDGKVGGTKAVTTITADIVLVGDDQKYWEVYSNATNRWIPYLQVDGSGTGAPVVAPISGVTDHYVAIAVATGLPAGDISLTIVSALNLAPGWAFDSVVPGGVSDVIITASTIGSKPASDFANLPVHDTWAGSFVDGTLTTAANETTKINYDRALVQDMVGKWFKMWGAADNGVLFYYQFPASPIDPATLGTTYTTAVAINLPTDYLKAESDVIEELSTAAILSTGLFAAVGKDGCCVEHPPCDDPPAVCAPRYTALLEENLPSSTGGTAEVGPANQIRKLIGPDGTNFGGNYEDDLAYAKAWNTIVVPDMMAKGIHTHYLKPVFGIPCIWCMQSIAPPGCIIIDCPDYDPNADQARLGSLMLRTTHLSITEDLKFNTPGNSFATNVSYVCPSCLI